MVLSTPRYHKGENFFLTCCQGPDISFGYITINEEGTLFNQTDEDTPDYFKMSVPAHNNYTEAVVFLDKKRVSMNIYTGDYRSHGTWCQIVAMNLMWVSLRISQFQNYRGGEGQTLRRMLFYRMV